MSADHPHAAMMDTQEELTNAVTLAWAAHAPQDTLDALESALAAVQAARALTFRDFLATVRPFHSA
jgi:hypothetical protein